MMSLIIRKFTMLMFMISVVHSQPAICTNTVKHIATAMYIIAIYM